MTRNGRLTIGACLSLSGRFARFGRQAAQGLYVWRALDGNQTDVVIEDDRSEPGQVESALTKVAGNSDLLLGPYSTQLMRIAGGVAAENEWLLWNHGGSGDDIEEAHPGNVVSVLTPTSRYAVPFVQHLAEFEPAELWIVRGKGSFGRQVGTGAEAEARRLGIATRLLANELPQADVDHPWDLFSTGTFEEDLEVIRRTLSRTSPPRTICSVAAGVREFRDHVSDPEGIFGVGQWFPGAWPDPALGPLESEFLTAWEDAHGTQPDYPAVQAVAAAVIAAHVARESESVKREPLWAAAAGLRTSTLFGKFGIDASTGKQLDHSPVLVRWSSDAPDLI